MLIATPASLGEHLPALISPLSVKGHAHAVEVNGPSVLTSSPLPPHPGAGLVMWYRYEMSPQSSVRSVKFICR